MNNTSNQSVFKRVDRPYIYLLVDGKLYYYNPNSVPLGRGAMGTVFLGYSCSSNQRVAIKRIKDIYANNKIIRERARQESSLCFVHPNLVKMIGLCEYQPNYGPMFVLSEYISGITLETHVKEQLNVLPFPDKIGILSREICCVLDALQFLHMRGVVHRDVKPSNIMLENGTTVKLMDLGIARLTGGNKYSSCGFIGTPQYSAPEQILRDERKCEVTAQSDIYSTGVTFYELLTGKNPYLSDIESEILSRQISLKLPYDKRIPISLYKVLLKATEKQSNQRYKSALEFKMAIEEALLHSHKSFFVTLIQDHLLSIVGFLILLLFIIFYILILL